MTVQQFLSAAAAIEADPLKRLSQVTKELIGRNNYVYDAHMHIFDRKCVPAIYFLIRTLKEKLELDSMAATDESIEDMYKMLQKGETEDEMALNEMLWNMDAENSIGEAMIAFLNNNSSAEMSAFSTAEAFKVVLKNSMGDILDYFNENFALNNFNPFQSKESLAVVLAMDLETGWGRKTKRSYREQIKGLQELAETKPILPFFAIDPRRADLEGDGNLYKMFIDAFTHPETPFFGVKCYPALGYLPSDARLKHIFDVCQEKNIPVLTHCGGTAVSTFDKEIVVQNSIGRRITVPLPPESRIKRADYLNNPWHWDGVMHQFPNLKLNFAHFGAGSNWLEPNPTNGIRISYIIDRLSLFGDSIYTDFSFNLAVDDALNALYSSTSTNDLIQKRLMYGTDFWVVLPNHDLRESIKSFIFIFSENILDLVLHNPNKYLFGIERPGFIGPIS